jgi:hypothetical protein
MNPRKTTTIEEALELCLEALEPETPANTDSLAQFPQFQNELGELITLIGPLKDLGEVAPRNLKQVKAREQFISNLPAREKPRFQNLAGIWALSLNLPRQRLRTVKIALTLLFTFMFLMVGGVFIVDASNPGDVLYGVDRKLEQMYLGTASSPEGKAKIHLGFAAERLKEARKEINEGRIENAIKALSFYNDEVSALVGLEGDAGAIDQEQLSQYLTTVRTHHKDVLIELLSKVPETAQPAIQRAIEKSNPADNAPKGPPDMRKNPPADAEGTPDDHPNGPPEGVGPPDNIPASATGEDAKKGEEESPLETPGIPSERIEIPGDRP